MNEFHHAHRQIIQDELLDSMLKNETRRQDGIFSSLVKEIIVNLRKFCLFDTWYPRASEIQVIEFLNSPINFQHQQRIYDSPTSLSYPTAVTTKINQFMASFPKYFDIIYYCFELFLKDGLEMTDCCPCPNPLIFFAASTFQGLFGYSWCAEQMISCVNTMVKWMTYSIPPGQVTHEKFKSSFVPQIVFQFLHTSGVQDYLCSALSSDFIRTIDDANFMKIHSESPNYSQEVLRVAVRFTNSLLGSLNKMPTRIRYFYKMMGQAYSDPSESRIIVGLLFFDTLIRPAIMNPKLFSILPESTSVSFSKQFSLVTRVLTWSFLPDIIPAKYKQLAQMTAFKSLRTLELLGHLLNDEFELNDEIFASQLQAVSKTKQTFLLFSVNDIQFMSDVITQTIDHIGDFPNKEKLKQMLTFPQQLLTTNSVFLEYWYTCYTLPDTGYNPPELIQSQMKLPVTDIPDYLLQTEVSDYSKHVILFLSKCQLDDQAPSEILPFLEFQMRHANELLTSEPMTKTLALISKTKEEKIKDEEVLGEIQAYIGNKVLKQRIAFVNAYNREEWCSKLKDLSERVIAHTEALKPMTYQCILRLFLHRNQLVEEELNEKRQDLITSAETWITFYTKVHHLLATFTSDLKLTKDQAGAVSRQLHSYLVRELKFSEFRRLRPPVPSPDYDSLLVTFFKKIGDVPDILRRLFDTPECFSVPIKILEDGMHVGAPLERLDRFEATLEAVREIYGFEADEKFETTSGNDIIVLVAFVLLAAKLPDLPIVLDYVTHFLLSVDAPTALLSQNQRIVISAFFCASSYLLK